VCCSVLQCVAVCCSVLQCVAVCCSVLQCAAVYCSVPQCAAVCCSVSTCHESCEICKRSDAVHGSVLQCVAVWYIVLQCVYLPRELSEHRASIRYRPNYGLATISTGWPRCVERLNLLGHFPQKSPVISGSFAGQDLRLTASYASLPPCRLPIWLGLFSKSAPIFRQKSPIYSI